MDFDILEWQEGDVSAQIRLVDGYRLGWTQVSNYPVGQSDFINRDAFGYFAINKWKPLSMTSKIVGALWWKQEVNVWVFIREHQ